MALQRDKAKAISVNAQTATQSATAISKQPVFSLISCDNIVHFTGL